MNGTVGPEPVRESRLELGHELLVHVVCILARQHDPRHARTVTTTKPLPYYAVRCGNERRKVRKCARPTTQLTKSTASQAKESNDGGTTARARRGKEEKGKRGTRGPGVALRLAMMNADGAAYMISKEREHQTAQKAIKISSALCCTFLSSTWTKTRELLTWKACWKIREPSAILHI